MRIVIAYDEDNGEALSDKGMREEFETLANLCESYREINISVYRKYSNADMIGMARLLYTRGYINHKDLFFVFEEGQEPIAINEYGAWTNVPNDFGKDPFDICTELAKFAIKVRKDKIKQEGCPNGKGSDC